MIKKSKIIKEKQSDIAKYFEKRSLTDNAYLILKKQIIKGELYLGKKLKVKDLSDSFGISPTPIKEALNRLLADGLVSFKPRSGFYVSNVSESGFRELMELCIIFESYGAKQGLTKNLDQALIEELKKPIDEEILMRDSKSNDYETIAEVDRIFHRNLVKLAENRKMLFFYDNMSYQLHALMISYIEKYKPIQDIFIESHTAILNSLLKKDKVLLQKNIELHINKNFEVIQKYILKKE
jgi:DNA-binding GntR family transcriptional regulator